MEIEKAYKAWQQAINIFNNAVEKDEIDYAIYNLEAKRKQYMRLLNCKKGEKIEENKEEDFT